MVRMSVWPSCSGWDHQSPGSHRRSTATGLTDGRREEEDVLADTNRREAHSSKVGLVARKARGLRTDPCWNDDGAEAGPSTGPAGHASLDDLTWLQGKSSVWWLCLCLYLCGRIVAEARS